MPTDLLVVDDEAALCAALKRFFESRGCRVATAMTADDALRQLSGLPAAVVLLDLKLPDASGLELLSRMKAADPGIRVVVISGLADEQTVQQAKSLGANDYLTKPFDFGACWYAAMGIETVNVRETEPTAEALSRVPADVAHHYRLVPLRVEEDALVAAMDNPLDIQALDELRTVLGCQVKPLAAVGTDIEEAIRRWYGVGADVSGRTGAAIAAVTASQAAPPTEEAGIVKLINDLIRHAYHSRASDLHVGRGTEGAWIRERIDGMLYDVPVAAQLSDLYENIVSRFKVMARLNIAEHRLPQDGRIVFSDGDVRLDLRVSVLPTPHGESLVIRLLEPSQVFRLDQLGMTDEQLRRVGTILDRPTGLLLVTGPTGSGKTTTLYAFLSRLNTGQANIVTIEDPIEHELPRLTQVQIQPKIGLTFAAGLRSMLRHDPDIIMVGEIRDQETASLAVRAALTGHLVLSTLHTNDAASGFTRLLDLGIEPFLLASTVAGVLSQRLIRVLCRQCRQPVRESAAVLGEKGIVGVPDSGQLPVWQALGCRYCRQTGYHGRTGVFELLSVDHQIRALLARHATDSDVRQAFQLQRSPTLWQASLQKLTDGTTCPEELLRVLPRELE